MELEHLQRHWHAFGERDALWAILTAPGKRGGVWELDEFFATGRAEVGQVLDLLAERGVAVEWGRALDFGCGVGRLTQALGGRFDVCDGVDVAGSMIERARELNQRGERVRFHHNEAPNLGLFGDGSFDFILSLIVLQHMEPALMRGYLREFMRVLRPGGVAYFNVPERYRLGEELPDQACRASLSLVGSVPVLVPGQVAPLTIRVRNDSPLVWPTAAQLRVGNHWRADDGKMLVPDDARSEITAELAPGAELDVRLDVVAPGDAGEYQLEVDLLQEWIGWFADRGGGTLRVPVVVSGARVDGGDDAARAATGGGPEVSPTMEMHVMSREDVASTVEETGGVVLEVIPWDRCGPAIPSLDYVIARAVTPISPRAPGEPAREPGSIEARIRAALDAGAAALRLPSTEPRIPDPQAEQRRRRARSTIEASADVAGFALTSNRGRLGRASIVVRGAVRRMMFQVLDRQTEFNHATRDVLLDLGAQVESLGATVKTQLDLLTGCDARLQELERARQAAVEKSAELERKLARAEINAVALGRQAARRGSAPAFGDLDYPAFTDAFRGRREQIRDRQQKYVQAFAGSSDVVDLGCGRGEFLDLLRDAGIVAVGVDCDEDMVGLCRQHGLDVVHGDCLQFLRARPIESHGGIFAARLIEHLPAPQVVELVRLAFSRLRPGGALVLETVNPMCLLTYATFYGDFTREAPLSPPALRWLADSCGFASAEIEYTSPVEEQRKLAPLPSSVCAGAQVEAFNRGMEATNELLFGYQEYALVARKSA